MPITSSAKKALRQSKKRKVLNTAKKDAYRRALKEFRKLAGASTDGASDAAKTALVKLYKTLDKAAKINAISKNKASRLKSRAAVKLV